MQSAYDYVLYHSRTGNLRVKVIFPTENINSATISTVERVFIANAPHSVHKSKQNGAVKRLHLRGCLRTIGQLIATASLSVVFGFETVISHS